MSLLIYVSFLIVVSAESEYRGGHKLFSSYQIDGGDGNHLKVLSTGRITDVKIVDRRNSDEHPTATERPTVVQDQSSHVYYTTTYSSLFYEDYPWVDLSAHPQSVKSTELSNRHLQAEIKQLEFSFPFYGHNVTTVAVTTGGFIYMSEFFHRYLAQTQYVAPLMAHFNLSVSPVSSVYYLNTIDGGKKRFVVQWDHVYVQEHVLNGSFTFQCILVEDGAIVMLYKEMPIAVTSISSLHHPVTVGVADAFYIDRTVFFGFVRRYIYEYHGINMSAKYEFKSGSSLLLRPIPNCVSTQTCQQCIANSNFDCKWCGSLHRCSDGIDRHRQEWIDSNCSNMALSTCMKKTSSDHVKTSSDHEKQSDGLSPGAYVGIAVGIIVIIAVALIAIFIMYAYHHPTSQSGLWLIQHGAFWKRFQKSKEPAVSENPYV